MKLNTNTLAFKHVIAIISVSVAFSFTATLYQGIIQYRRGIEAQAEVVSMIEDSYVPAIAAGLFFFDDQQLQLLMDGILLLPYIEYTEIVEHFADQNKVIMSTGESEVENGATHTFPLIHEYEGRSREIGELRVVMSLNKVHQSLMQQISVAVIADVLKILGFAFFVVIVAHNMIFRHLRKINEFLHSLDPAAIDEKQLELPRGGRAKRKPDELDEITTTINTMLERLGSTIQELKVTQNDLEIALDEKRLLLQELYHRTKNNMETIRSILKMEAAKVRENGKIWETVREVDNRILAMALVHQRLHGSHNLSRIEMGDYVTELTREILYNYDVLDKKIHAKIEVENMALLIDTAIPCGMALVELLSNAVKHAFPGNRRGLVEVKLHRIDKNLLQLSVSDNGVGVEEDFDFRKSATLGLHTVAAIAEKQLNGQLKFEGSGGVRCSIIFSDTSYRERI
ncbi:MAG: hypothetical protein K9L66_08215 [Spirochaetaceae bacterium]|nr:hypothetical protein [Spirochaetaceae bacterium]MCF7951497.1 hypothetical protein [Spirochaetaceae bacterium]